MSIFKTIVEKNINSFQTHKNYEFDIDVSDNNYGSGSIKLFKLHYEPYLYPISDTNNSINNSLTNSNWGWKNELVFDSIYHNLYKDYFSIPTEKILFNNPHEKRYIKDKITAITIDNDKVGEGINKNSVYLQFNVEDFEIGTNILSDDGNGNLIDIVKYSSSLDCRTVFDKYLILEHLFYDHNIISPKVTDSSFFKNTSYSNNILSNSTTHTAQFNGSSSFYRIDNNELLNKLDEYAIGFKVKIKDFNDCILIAKNTKNKLNKVETNSVYPIQIELVNDTIKFSVYDGINELSVFSNSLILDNTYYVFCQYYNKQIEIYIDGVLQSSNSISTLNNILNDGDIYVGSLLGNSKFFSGEIDNLKIFNNFFSQANIIDYSNCEINGSIDYIVGNVFYNAGLIILNSSEVNISLWILRYGYWEDDMYWVDTEVWNDN